jgi:hypothetical protein
MYQDGVGVERDQKKALEWFQKSARKSKAPSKRAMGDIYRDGLVVEKNIPEAIKWYEKAAEEGDLRAKTELLKLRSQESAKEGPGTESEPDGKAGAQAPAEAANMRPAGMSVEKIKEKAPEKPGKTAENVIIPLRGKLQPLPQTESSKLRIEKKIPEKKGKKPVPKRIKQAKTTHAPRKSLYLFSAIGIVALSLVVLFIAFGKKADKTWGSMEPKATNISALPRPDPRSIPPLTLQPAGEFLKKINAAKAPVKKTPAPIIEASQAAARTEPIVPRLRREYKSLDEGEISRTLAAKNIFDAERNPGGNFQHRYEIRNSAGLSLIFDHATSLAWARQQNPVKMNLKKSLEWIASLNNVAYGGIKTWRLPTVEEAAALLKKNTPDGKIFLDAVFGEGITVIWTGDGSTGSESWVVDFQNGMTNQAKNKSRLATLMVSSAPD